MFVFNTDFINYKYTFFFIRTSRFWIEAGCS